MPLLLDGNETSKAIRQEVARDVSELFERTGVRPCIAAILAGDNPASEKYVSMKERACAKAGIISRTYPFSSSASQSEVEDTVLALNSDPSVHGILIQHPLPPGMNEPEVLAKLLPEKDVDGIAPISMGRLMAGMESFNACTSDGMVELLKRYNLPITGKHAVVVGRSVIVGKPLALLLLAANATVTICHSRTVDLPSVTRTADILCAAIGKPEFITGDMIKPGAVVLDAGYNRTASANHDVGDVHFESASKVASAITPVPGGVGPMTIAILLRNTLRSAQRAASR
jgi:methylenetetrahydrofolate dehydrogenase (NADP+)/methenyltetrahydrofolate cyclohydrolase